MFKQSRAILAIALVPALLGLAACGDDDSSDSGTGAGATATAAASHDTVSAQSISGAGTVLVDAQGMALYTNDMDKGSKFACTGACLTEWIPLTAQGQPSSSDDAIQPKLGTVQRPDGSSQVTFDGLPLYTFVDDSSGQVTGNGFADSFGGTEFVWTVASAGDGAGAAPTTTSDSDDDSSGGGIGY
jgi:predicted lipoprotein with Yx(FWY)xxD motif